jgi:SAM-dependent methyltransferase
VTTSCPACGSDQLSGFHRAGGVPTNSCLLLEDEREARAFSRGVLDLAHCQSCGFVTNRAFDPGATLYSDRYEETQSFSPRFVDFGRQLAKEWVERYGLQGKHVLEVGCGKGEFLVWMLEAGAGSGVGIDPGIHADRHHGDVAARARWIEDLYDERYAHLVADAVVCRHTLEHIQPVREFLSMVRQNLGERLDTVVLFELPDVARVLDEVAFWDVYYEHCSYFSAGSLARLFRRCRFEVLDLSYAFDDQYLLIEARPSREPGLGEPGALEDDFARLEAGVTTFRDGYRAVTARWRRELQAVADRGQRSVVWGGGSKAVAFLTSLGIDDLVAAAVDINPHKQGRFIAGTGHRVLAPEDLPALAPDLVVAMNPVYLDEIRRNLDELGLGQTRLVAL